MIACGLDIGSTNVKAVLCGEDGRTLWVKSVPTPRRSDGVGIASDAAALVTLLEELIIEGWQAVGAKAPIAAIAAAGVVAYILAALLLMKAGAWARADFT